MSQPSPPARSAFLTEVPDYAAQHAVVDVLEAPEMHVTNAVVQQSFVTSEEVGSLSVATNLQTVAGCIVDFSASHVKSSTVESVELHSGKDAAGAYTGGPIAVGPALIVDGDVTSQTLSVSGLSSLQTLSVTDLATFNNVEFDQGISGKPDAANPGEYLPLAVTSAVSMGHNDLESVGALSADSALILEMVCDTLKVRGTMTSVDTARLVVDDAFMHLNSGTGTAGTNLTEGGFFVNLGASSNSYAVTLVPGTASDCTFTFSVDPTDTYVPQATDIIQIGNDVYGGVYEIATVTTPNANSYVVTLAQDAKLNSFTDKFLYSTAMDNAGAATLMNIRVALFASDYDLPTSKYSFKVGSGSTGLIVTHELIDTSSAGKVKVEELSYVVNTIPWATSYTHDPANPVYHARTVIDGPMTGTTPMMYELTNPASPPKTHQMQTFIIEENKDVMFMLGGGSERPVSTVAGQSKQISFYYSSPNWVHSM